MTKQRTQISVNDAQRALRDLEMRYGSRVQITVDEDFNFELVDNEDLAEETPEESQKRAERQAKGQLDAQAKVEQAEPGRFTVPAEVLAPKPAQALKDRKDDSTSSKS